MHGPAATIRLLSLAGLLMLSTPLAAEQRQRVDANGDGEISAEEHAAAAKARFDAIDTDHDGKITAAECTAHVVPKRMTCADVIAKMDTDGNGAISADEQTASARKRFDRLDANHDGKLTKTEITAAKSSLHDALDTMYQTDTPPE